jgi:hypothetical protein
VHHPWAAGRRRGHARQCIDAGVGGAGVLRVCHGSAAGRTPPVSYSQQQHRPSCRAASSALLTACERGNQPVADTAGPVQPRAAPLCQSTSARPSSYSRRSVSALAVLRPTAAIPAAALGGGDVRRRATRAAPSSRASPRGAARLPWRMRLDWREWRRGFASGRRDDDGLGRVWTPRVAAVHSAVALSEPVRPGGTDDAAVCAGRAAFCRPLAALVPVIWRAAPGKSCGVPAWRLHGRRPAHMPWPAEHLPGQQLG